MIEFLWFFCFCWFWICDYMIFDIIFLLLLFQNFDCCNCWYCLLLLDLVFPVHWFLIWFYDFIFWLILHLDFSNLWYDFTPVDYFSPSNDFNIVFFCCCCLKPSIFFTPFKKMLLLHLFIPLLGIILLFRIFKLIHISTNYIK